MIPNVPASPIDKYPSPVIKAEGQVLFPLQEYAYHRVHFDLIMFDHPPPGPALSYANVGRPLPPGPPSYPIIGQLLSMPQTTEGPEFANLSKTLKSDIISLSGLGTTIVVLNSTNANNDLLEKRAKIYSGRFCTPMISSPQLMDLRDFVAFMDSNDSWKEQRRAISAQLNTRSVCNFRSSQDQQARRLLQRFLDVCGRLESSDELEQEFYRAVSAVFFDTVYGYELKSLDDPFHIDNMTLNNNITESLMPSKFLVNVFPWLQYIPGWVPGAGWKKKAYEWREQKNRTMDGVYNWTKQRVTERVDDYSIISSTIKDAQKAGWGETEIDTFAKNLGTALLVGGSGLSTTAFSWFILALALFPEAQAKAQSEIDEVIGPDRLPTFDDQPRLPYVQRLLLEVLRWQAPAPLGVPHMCTKDDEYQGYRIPKGAIMIGNIWAFNQDGDQYKDPDMFNPDRFLDPSVPPPPIFGSGLRICPGRYFFQDLFFIQAVLILATFKVGRYKDKQGHEIEPVRRVIAGSAVAHPATFKLKVSPRSRQHVELIQTAL
ncbi:unnamed protein product [Rhizoctonia solani]|uniref:O-methylsterigmatocystin oxidoreductase n=1 Tax=Rhizoctonia solani TaxID=456999 RepID=A0A8H3B355_9AGAM|nr:unnamed protein product [Rhizoctonia solani]